MKQQVLILFFLLSFQILITSQDDTQSDCQAGQLYDKSSKTCEVCRQEKSYSEDGHGSDSCKQCPDVQIVHCKQNITDCQAGQHYVGPKKECRNCPNKPQHKWSNDAATKCEKCNGTNTPCICDTTSPEHYKSGDNSELKEKCLDKDNELNCSKACYLQSRHAMAACRICNFSEAVNIIDCNCNNNRKTKDSCVKRKQFTKECFQNECDRTMHYLNDSMLATLDSCYNQYKVDGTCGRSECAEPFSSYQAVLKTCNCYHTYLQTGTASDTTESCLARKDFSDRLSEKCTEKPSHATLIITIVLSTGGLLIIAGIMYLGQRRAVNYGRELKKSGRIGSILKYIDWDKIVPLGAARAACALQRKRDPDNLQSKEILLKIRFNLFGGCFGVQCQHVVLKIFSESQSEQWEAEMGIINSISDKDKAKKCNIITVYGPTIREDNRDLISFLETMIKKSTNCAPLRDVIQKTYLGGDIQDQNMENPRCKYIMMNHCNELSLTKFIRSDRLKFDLIKHLCKDLAQALKYLHEINNPTIVHCDIKPDNIFVKSRNKKMSFILGDFGFAEKTAGAMFRLTGSTPSYLPPEWYLDHKDNNGTIELKNELASDLQKRVFSERAVINNDKMYCKIDIYSYGLIIWLALHNEVEPWTEKYSDDYKNYKKEQNDQKNYRISKEMFLHNLFNDPNKFETRPKCEKDHSNELKDFTFLLDLARQCWQSDSRLRPSASEILKMLHDNVLISSGNSRRVLYQVHNSVSDEVQPPVYV